MKKLEIGNFLVRDIVFGEKTAYEGAILTVNREEATKAINPLGKLKNIELHIVHPGDSVRICPVKECGGAEIQAGRKGPFSRIYGTCYKLRGGDASCHEGNCRAGLRPLQQHGGRHPGHERSRSRLQLSFHHHKPCDFCGKDE